MSIKWKTVYPGVYDEYEQQLVDEIQEYISGDEAVLTEKINKQNATRKFGRGKMELYPGIQFLDTVVGTNDILYHAYRTNPNNPLYTDPTYWRKTRYKGQPAAPNLLDIGPAFPYIPKGKDETCWVMVEDFTPRGLDHEVTFYKPIYAGQHVVSACTSQTMTDVTDPNGSEFRKFRVEGTCEVRDGDTGELLQSGHYRAIEPFKMFEDPAMKEEYDKPFELRVATHCNWDTVRPRHVYTDEDYAKIKDIWSKEYVRGADTLYWEDVNIGDEPAWTCDGPYTEADRWNGGNNLRVQKSQTARDVIMQPAGAKPQMGPPGPPATVEPDEYGVLTLKQGGGPGGPGGMPGGPGGGKSHPNQRSSFMNTVGRDYGSKFVTNWCGDDGWLHKICWRLAFCMDQGKNAFPEDFDRPSYLLKVPYLKEAGRFMDTHGFVGDVAITKGYVCDKYIKDGKHYVDLVLWCETIEGGIFAEMYAVVELPSKEE